MAGPKHSELPAVVVPQHLWLRSARPAQGKVVQWALPAVLILGGLVVSTTTLRVSLVLAGFSAFLLLPGLVTSRLEQFGREVMAADRRRAGELLKELPERAIVRLFAPTGWRALQLALLNLKLGDGQQAALGFAETAQLCGQPDAVMLLSAQAHALVVAGERVKARELLQKLTHANLLGPRDQLDLGIVLLIETKKFKQALSYIEAARKTIGDHPRVLAAQALALQKAERIDDASVLLEQVQIMMKDAAAVDPVADDLIKRARKGLQDYLEAQLRKERRSRSRRTTIVVSSEAAASEIVSGEISGSAEPTTTEAGLTDSRSEVPSEPLRRFTHAEPTPMPAPMPTEPRSPAPDLMPSEPRSPAPNLMPSEPRPPRASRTRRSRGWTSIYSRAPTQRRCRCLCCPHALCGRRGRPGPGQIACARPRGGADSDRVHSRAGADVATGPTLIVSTVAEIGTAKTLVATTPAATTPTAVTPTPTAASVPTPARAPAGASTGFTPTSASVATPAPVAAATSDAKSDAPKTDESEVPGARPRQTLLGLLPGEPGKPPAPNFPSLNPMGPLTGAPAPAAMPRTGLPTRATRLDLPATGGTPAPNTSAPSPVFRAPPKPSGSKPDDKKG